MDDTPRFTTRCFMLASQAAIKAGVLSLQSAPVVSLHFADLPDPGSTVTVVRVLEVEGFDGDLATGLALVDPAGVALRHDRFLDSVSPAGADPWRPMSWVYEFSLDDVTEEGVHTFVWLIEGQEHDRLRFNVVRGTL